MSLDLLYFAGSALMWVGNVWQSRKLWLHKSAKDISLTMMTSVFLAHCLMMPKSLSSGIPVWFICHLISLIMVGVVVVLIVYYRRGIRRKSE